MSGTYKKEKAGNRYGRLTVLREYKSINGRMYWMCRCDCGAEIAVRGNLLRSGRTRSCGCLSAENCQRIGRLNKGKHRGRRKKVSDGQVDQNR